MTKEFDGAVAEWMGELEALPDGKLKRKQEISHFVSVECSLIFTIPLLDFPRSKL